MHPLICQIGPLKIYSYGVLMALAVIICTFLLKRDAQKANLLQDTIVDLVFWVVIGGIVGSRIFFILLNFSYFVGNPLEIFMIQHGGLAWQGGLILGSLAGFFFLKKKNVPIAKVLDLVSPYIALGQSIGRIGCFLNGCCYGKPVAWGIFFPVHDARLHPTQLYTSFNLLLIFFILKKYQQLSKKEGQVFILYLLLASCDRFFVEFFRADHETLWMGLSIFQIISLIIILLAIYAHIYLNGCSRK